MTSTVMTARTMNTKHGPVANKETDMDQITVNKAVVGEAGSIRVSRCFSSLDQDILTTTLRIDMLEEPSYIRMKIATPHDVRFIAPCTGRELIKLLTVALDEIDANYEAETNKRMAGYALTKAA